MRYILIVLIYFISSPIMSQTFNDTLSIIYNRTSVRDYTEQKVEAEKVEALLRAGMAAPSSRNVQPWVFYVIEDTLILNQLSERLPSAGMLKGAQLAIVVCADLTKGNPNEEQIHNWIMDCSAASQNILLAAHALELGAVWTGVFPYKERINIIREVLDIPENISPLSLIPVGYPATNNPPKDKWDPGKIHWIRNK